MRRKFLCDVSVTLFAVMTWSLWSIEDNDEDGGGDDDEDDIDLLSDDKDDGDDNDAFTKDKDRWWWLLPRRFQTNAALVIGGTGDCVSKEISRESERWLTSHHYYHPIIIIIFSSSSLSSSSAFSSPKRKSKATFIVQIYPQLVEDSENTLGRENLVITEINPAFNSFNS